ncbi:D-alanine--poly(phosphoribitol) ligase subunit 2 [Clostridioides difficile]|nr:D-alanine--poly(phosphoribitol) ligase subunit 2 [Clostridioides difficile]
MQETVIEIFEDVLGTDEIREDLDLNLFETELLDSLAIIEVLLEIENRLGIELQPTDLERKDMSTVNNLVKFLETRNKLVVRL